MVYYIGMNTIVPIIISLFITSRAEAAPPSFSGAQPLLGEITWSPGAGMDSWTASRVEAAWEEWEKLSGGAIHPVMVSSGAPRVVFHCSDDFPIGVLDGTEITVGEDVKVKLRHVNLSTQICDNPSRIIMLHAVGHALGWDNDLSSVDGVMSGNTTWGFGPSGDRGFSESDVQSFRNWYAHPTR
jgi:hypothetical protein